MRLVRALRYVDPASGGRVVTLGNFDGVHVAHQAICRRVAGAGRTRGLESLALTFHPHPAKILAPARAPAAILRISERLRRLGETGVDTVVAQRFSAAFSRIEAEEFVRRYLAELLHAVHVVVGHSVRFGRNRAGDDVLLRRLGDELGFTVEVIGPVEVGGVVVSSTAIRQAVAAGDLPRATALLGREHYVVGRVVHGDHRGATLGFPTANLRLRDGLLPPDGVYAVRVQHGESTFGGVANLGRKPTFGPAERGLEAHIFGFEGDLYGQRLRLAFVGGLRGEVKFPNAQALIEQIGRDAAAARALLEER